MLHRRIEALLISQAFLVAAYVQVFISADFDSRVELKTFAIVVLALGLSINLLASRSWTKLVEGGNLMKVKYLTKLDPIYQEYFDTVRAPNGRRRWSMSTHLPTILYAFWGGAAMHLLVHFFW
jgi:hypothetical protein